MTGVWRNIHHATVASCSKKMQLCLIKQRQRRMNSTAVFTASALWRSMQGQHLQNFLQLKWINCNKKFCVCTICMLSKIMTCNFIKLATYSIPLHWHFPRQLWQRQSIKFGSTYNGNSKVAILIPPSKNLCEAAVCIQRKARSFALIDAQDYLFWQLLIIPSFQF